MADDRVTILAVLQDRFSGPLRMLLRGLTRVGRAAARIGRTGLAAPFVAGTRAVTGLIGRLTSLRTLIVAGVGAAAVRSFTSFEDRISQVSTLVDTAVVDMKRLESGVLDIGEATGESFENLADGLFDIVSAGVPAAQSLEVLAQATKLAQAGGTDVSIAVKGLVALLNAYGLKASDAADVSDILFQAMKGGITNIEALASNLGKVAPVARAAGISLADMTAAVSALTKGGLSTEESVTALRATISGIVSPTQEAAQMFRKAFGASESPLAALNRLGAVEFLRELAKETNSSTEEVAKLFPNIRAQVGVLALMGDNVKNLADLIGTMGDRIGSTDEAYDKIRNNLSKTLGRLGNSIRRFFIEIVRAAKPFIENVVGNSQQGTGLAGFFSGLSKQTTTIQALFAGIGEIFRRVGVLATTLFDQGEILRFIKNVVVAAIRLIADLFIAGLPVLLTAARFIGRRLAIGVIDTFIGNVEGELAKRAAKAGFAFTKALEASLGTEAVATLKKFGQELQDLDDQIAITQHLLATGFGETEEARLLERTAPHLATTTAELEAELLRLQRQRVALLERPSIVEEVVQREQAALQSQVNAFEQAAVPILQKLVQRLGANLTEESRTALNSLILFLVKEFPELMAAAAALDTAKEEGRKAGRAFGEGVKEGVQEETEKSPTVPNTPGTVEGSANLLEEVGSGLTSFIEQFRTLKTLGEQIGSALFNAIGGLIDLWIAGESSFSEFAKSFLRQIAKMIVQTIIFRAIAAGLFGGSGGGDVTESGIATGSRGGLVGLFRGMGRIAYGAGSEFVPGPRTGRDTVRALLMPGEAVMRTAAVDYYGKGFMRMINHMLLPKGAAHALAEGAMAGSSVVKRSFASGGDVARTAGGSRGDVVLPTIPVTRATSEALMNNGVMATAMANTVAANVEKFRSILGITTSGSRR